MITEQYVEFETAKLLKEKGFPQHIASHTYFVGDDKKRGCFVGEFIGHQSSETDIHLIDAPTQSLAMRWLREAHNIHIDVVFLGPSLKWTPTIWKIDTKIPKSYHVKSTMNTWETYEEATEIAIKYCLENLI